MSVQIAKIQLRRGVAADLPGAPVTLTPPTFAPGLDDGELGFTTDAGRLFLGQISPTNGTINYQRVSFPYQNVEVLTENTPAKVFRPVLADNQTGFNASVPLSITNIPLTLQTFDANHVATDFHLDLPISGANTSIWYYVFAANQTALRKGVLHIIWSSATVGSPIITDSSIFLAAGATGDLVWSATQSGGTVLLKYVNKTGDTPTVYFRLDRPVTTAPTYTPPPGAPDGLATGTITTTTIPVTWNALVGSGLTYVVQWSPHSAGTWTSLAATASTSATVSGLTTHTSYDIRVFAKQGALSGPTSPLITATTS